MKINPLSDVIDEIDISSESNREKAVNKKVTNATEVDDDDDEERANITHDDAVDGL